MVGEHIRILKEGRWIHAIDCGDQTVLHLSEDTPPPRVRRAYRPEFVAGADAVEVVTHRERTFPAKEIVKRAYSRASDPTLASMFGDSEAFVEWCTTGRLSTSRNVALETPSAAAPVPAPTPAAKPAKRKAAPAAKAKARPAPRAKAGKAKRVRAKATPRRAAPAAARRKPARARPARRATKPARRSAGARRKGKR